MTSPTPATILLAGQILFGARRLGAARGRTQHVAFDEMLVYLMIAAGVIAAVCLTFYLVSRLVQRRRYYSHGSLFNGLCRTHGLDHGARALLKRVASHHKLRQPARLFTEPNWLDPAGLRGALRQRSAGVLAVRNRLFAQGAR